MSTPAIQKTEIALLGGAFDPVTRGHLQAAEYTLQGGAAFDQVWLMPCYAHAYNKQMAASHHRLQMCRFAATGRSNIRVFDYEIVNECTGGTYWLMQQLLAEEFSHQYNYSMIIGLDNANTFHHWINHIRLAGLIRFIVIPRKGVEIDPGIDWYLHPPHIYLKRQCDIMDVSSTLVRELLAQARYSEAAHYIEPAVLDYILKNKLYVSA